MMNELALFAGAGGGLLGTQEIGLETIAAVELDEYCQCVLIYRQNQRQLKASFPIWDDIRTFNGNEWRGKVDIVTGGFPCQAFSTASHGRKTAQNLWPEMFRVIKEIQPKYVFAENVTKKAIERAAEDLCKVGYKTEMLSISAADLGADHLRRRYWLLAYTDDKSELQRTINAKMENMQKFQDGIWSTRPIESGMVNGMVHRVDKFRAIGNGQVPVVAAAALWSLAYA